MKEILISVALVAPIYVWLITGAIKQARSKGRHERKREAPASN